MRQFLLGLIVVTAGLSALAQRDASGSNQDNLPQSSSSNAGFFRRLIFQGSVVNAGYEGGNSSRYSQPNGWSAGLTFDLIGSENLVLELGALYRQLGTTAQNGFGNNSITANYISVPLDLKYYFSGQEKNSLYLKAGVMGSTLISNDEYYVTPTTQIGARSWETAALAGIGVKLKFSASTDFLVEADYTRALDSVFAGQDIYRSDFSAMLGLGLNL